MGYRSLLLALVLLFGPALSRADDTSADKKDDKTGDEGTAPQESPDKDHAPAAPGKAPARAQTTQSAATSRGGKPAAQVDMPEAGEVRVRADVQEALEKGHYQARGSVDLRTPDLRVQADRIDVYEIEKPDGTKGKTIVAEGNVVFIRGDERIAGEKATLDASTGAGIFENARGFVESGLMVEARTIERIDDTTYHIVGGKFTACTQPDPRWGFSASTATVHAGDKVVGHNVVLRVSNIPALYLPYIVYPINEDQRATGFLFPRIGNSTIRGFTIGDGFYWVMGRSLDQTFYADTSSRASWDIGHEIRWSLDSPSHGDFRTFVYAPSAVTSGVWDYDLNWNGLEALPDGSRAVVLVRRYSNTFFQTQAQDNFNLATSRYEMEEVTLQKSVGITTFQIVAANDKVFFNDQTRIEENVPSLFVKRPSKRIFKTPITFAFQGSLEQLGTGNQAEVDKYTRLDLFPQLAMPISSIPFLTIAPKVSFRYTRYGHTLDTLTNTFVTGPPLTRRFFEGSLDITGPSFSHIFDNPTGVYSDKFKHVIGPFVTYTYRTAIDNFNLIPKFDGNDQALGTDEVFYGLIQRIYARRPSRTGKMQPFEFFTWRIGQTYYAQISDSQNEFDPNYTSGIFGPGGLPEHNSPVRSQLSISPSPAFGFTSDIEYDLNFKQFNNLSLGGQTITDRLSFQGTWNTAKQVATDPADRVTIRNFVRGAASLEVIPRRFFLDGSLNYDFVNKEMLQASGRLRWTVQCCGINAQVIERRLNTTLVERLIRFSLDLQNVGSMGGFEDDDPLHPALPRM